MQRQGSFAALQHEAAYMRKLITNVCFVLILTLRAISQGNAPRYTVEVRNMFVWGEDAPAGAISSVIRDPLTRAELRRLRHNELEITSQMGFEKLHPEDAAEFIVFSSTIVNNTTTELAIEPGGVAIDGRLVSLLAVNSSIKGMKQRHSNGSKGVVDIRSLHCFGSGFLSTKDFFPPPGVPSPMLVAPQSSFTVSAIVKDPRYYPMLCSVRGCFPKGTIRYSIRVGGHEYLFSWNGDSLANCGR